MKHFKLIDIPGLGRKKVPGCQDETVRDEDIIGITSFLLLHESHPEQCCPLCVATIEATKEFLMKKL